MTKQDFLLRLDELIEVSPGTLRGTDLLSDVPGWDSVAIMGFIALVDEEFGAPVLPRRLAACKTVDDLVALLGDRITA
jgi:acyl carrier protein